MTDTRPVKPKIPKQARKLVNKPLQKQQPGKRGPAPGRKGIRWDSDPDILRRLAAISSMLVQGAKAHDIAQAFGYSLATAHNDIRRIHELNRRIAMADVEVNLGRSIAQYIEIQTRAWEIYRDTNNPPRDRIMAMDQVRKAQEQIDRIQGNVAPERIDLSARVQQGNPRDLTEAQLAEIAAQALREQQAQTGDTSAP